MRTVSFSSAPVKEKLNNDFVCHVIDTDGDASAGSSQAHAPTDGPGMCAEGIGNQNVQTLFLTPEGKIFHTASGYRGPQELLSELNFAETLFKQIRHQPKEAQQLVKTSHRKRMKADGFTDEVLDRKTSAMNPFQDMIENMRNQKQRQANRQNRRSGSPFDAQKMNDEFFAGKTRQSKLLDYRFANENPLMAFEDFERNPRLLVGNATTAFASGPSTGGQIGGNSNPSSMSRAFSN